MHTAEFYEKLGSLDSAASRSLTLRYDAHHGVWLCRMMHTAESDSAMGCTPRSFFKIRISRRNRKYFSLFIRGLDGFESWKKWRSKISWHTPFNQELSHVFLPTITHVIFMDCTSSFTVPFMGGAGFLLCTNVAFLIAQHEPVVCKNLKTFFISVGPRINLIRRRIFPWLKNLKKQKNLLKEVKINQWKL